MADADLLSLGSHCQHPECSLLDFLPFTCDACGHVYCLDHRSYQSHNCSKAAGKDSTTLVCPLCAKAVKLIPGQDPNAAFEAHTSKDCDPSNYARVHRKLKCPVPGCKEKLTSINTYSCRSCSTDVCLKHRFPSDHACDARKVSQQQPPTSIMRSLLGMGSAKAAPAAETARKSASQQKPAAVPARASASTAARAAAEAAERRRQSSSQPLTALTGAQQAAASQPASERCPQCGNSFRTLQELLFHVEAYHPDGTASSGVEQCPHCGQSFANAVTLVEHVERNHARKELCVLC